MIKKIGVEQLQPGMYVHDLNCGWLDQPIQKNSFFVEDERAVESIREMGVRELYIDPTRGTDVADAPTQREVSEDLDRRLQELAARKEGTEATSVADESNRARWLHEEANRTVRELMEDVRHGLEVAVERVEPMIEGVVDSIFRNRHALLPRTRLKSLPTYAYEHSVGVCALMVAFGRSNKLPRDTIKEIGIGALLHDIGKARLPDDLLNKPGKLTEAEFEVARTHVTEGVDLLSRVEVSGTALQVVAEHHERFDGSGYPRGLKNGEISRYGQMAAIVDVYDAITSERVYHKAIPATQALKKLLEWSRHHFDPALVQAFIRTVGIYPVGSLVRLDSGRLGVVIDQNERNLLEPVVQVFYRADRYHHIPPEVVDLAQTQDRVVSFETYEKWNIDPYAWLPG